MKAIKVIDISYESPLIYLKPDLSGSWFIWKLAKGA